MTAIKKIVQIHASYEAMGVFECVSVERWQLLNPECEHVFLSNEDADECVMRSFPSEYPSYLKLPLGVRGDINRLCAVHHHGGLYADADYYPVRPLSEFTSSSDPTNLFSYADRELFIAGIFSYQQHCDLPLMIAEEIFRRLKDNPEPDINDDNTWRGWVFDCSGAHAYTACLNAAGYSTSNGITGCSENIESCGRLPNESLNAVHFGTERWMPRKRWQSADDQRADELRSLAYLKKRFRKN